MAGGCCGKETTGLMRRFWPMFSGKAYIFYFFMLVVALTGCNSGQEVADLSLKLQSQDSVVRNRAALKLAQLGPKAASAVPYLRQTIQDKEWIVRNSSAYALQRIGTAEATAVLEEALPVYLRALRDDQLTMRLSAAEGLGYFGRVGLRAVPELIATMENSQKLHGEYQENSPELAKYHYWIANQVGYTLQKLKGYTEQRK